MNNEINNQDITDLQHIVVYVCESNPLLQEILMATGKFIKDPSHFFITILLTTAYEAQLYGYPIRKKEVDYADIQYYWKHFNQKSAV